MYIAGKLYKESLTSMYDKYASLAWQLTKHVFASIVLNDWVHQYSALFFISPIKSFYYITKRFDGYSVIFISGTKMYMNYSAIYSTLKVIHHAEIIQKRGLKGWLAVLRLVYSPLHRRLYCVVAWLHHVGVVSINSGKLRVVVPSLCSEYLEDG